MNNIKYLFGSIILMLVLTVAGTIAQNTSKTIEKPQFDAQLAKRLGADKYGMKRYVFVALNTVPNAPPISKEESSKIFAGHFTNMGRLAEEGKLAVAGPFSDPKKIYRGLFILNVETVEEAEKLVNTDPVIKSGQMVAEYIPWWGTAALMDANRVHKTIAKEEM